ncbi:nitroreductase [Kribbella antibiotica]|uniref:Nitroreductase n=1 Tax=Kribbella antibiotica TaxID=190195 RepID=A0A4R4ZUA0_9ACTN|nr:nitroreductase family protein [Kribbella antibiotica]TDD60642.1 nitroreductase [Kribbella antibiotica]
MSGIALSADDRETMILAAVLAPSMHNTQPWRFRFAGSVVEVYRDRDRELPAEDPQRRMLFVSLGAAILNLRVGAAVRGYGSQVRHLVDKRRPDLVALVELGDPDGSQLSVLGPYLTKRRTNRQPYTDERVPDETRAGLDLAARIEGARLQWLDRPSLRWWLHMATKEAGGADDASRARIAERRQWVGGDRSVDGVPSRALGPRAARGLPAARDLAVAAADLERPLGVFEAEPQLAVLATRFDGPIEWLRAGQAMERVLLAAASHGLATSLLNQVIEHAELRWQINDPLGLWQRPQAVLRVGYGPPVLRTPRRPIADVLMHD